MDNTAQVLPELAPITTPLQNTRHERFCHEYLIDFNGTQAPIRAGFSEKGAKVAGVRLLSYSNVRARLAGLQKKRFERLDLSADFVLKTAHQLVQRCMQEVEPVIVHGIHSKDPASKRPLYTFQAGVAVKALEVMGKHVDVGAFNPDVNIENGTINVLIGGKRCTCGLCTCQGDGQDKEVGPGAPERVIEAGRG